MKRRFAVGALVVVALVMTIVPVAFAARGHRGDRHMGFGMIGKLHAFREELDLSDEQVTQIREIAGSLRDQNRPYRDQIKENLGAVAQTLIANPNNIAGAQSLLSQQLATEQEMKSSALRAAADALNVLTPEQRARLGEMVARKLSAE